VAGYYTVNEAHQTEITVKKSKFLSFCFPIVDERQAEDHLNEIRKQHFKATHNTYAYVYGKEGEHFKYSDDGEPSSTAGRPIYEAITGRNLSEVLVVVTRYFGGIKLGTGGLVRAYGSSAQKVLDEVETVFAQKNVLMQVTLDYAQLGSFEHLVSKYDSREKNRDFGQKVALEIYLPIEEEERFVKDVRELLQGTLPIRQGEAYIKKQKEKGE